MIDKSEYYHNILTHYASIRHLQNGQMVAPRFCTFQTSNQCNQNCMGCSFGGLNNKALNNTMMSEADHIRILYKLIDVGVRGFEFCGGGEPTLLPYLSHLFHILKTNNKAFGIITNGVKLNSSLIDYLSTCGTYCRISLEASNIEDYVKYKRVPSKHWSMVLRNVSAIAAIKDRVCDVSLKFDVGRTLNGKKHYEDAIKIGTELGVDSVQFKFLRHEPEELSVDEKYIEQTKLELVMRDTKTGVNIIDGLVPDQSIEDIPQCWLNPIHTVVDHLGDVYICCYYYYRGDEHKIGNMLKNDFEYFWDAPEHMEKIKNINRLDCHKVDCKFFAHHATVNNAFKNGRIEFL